MAQSIITQVTRETDSYTPCPGTVNDKGSINTTPIDTSVKGERMRSHCICHWLFSCFRGDETTPVNSLDAEDQHNSEVETHHSEYLLRPLKAGEPQRKCIVIDLDETLVHSSFRPVPSPDFVVTVEIDNIQHQVYVQKRPHVDEFLKRMGEMFECVLFTASLSKYADPVADLLDKWNTFDARLFRESCVFHKGNYVKDLSKLGRDLTQCVIIDNSPQSYIFHPDNAVPVTSWFDDPNDTELLDLLPFFEGLEKVENVLTVLGQNNSFHSSISSPTQSSPSNSIPSSPN
ncbi:PREDICTED: carboxy-terminal domain RNA polymerase II polypeptide A small phosphatase 1-like [Amphimedon queenslandica]|uniref:protein-serine/threonine phosphatase n=1 Tax=Amphimedon queenslandica TaxID=400682 RepID=A0A1X7VP07_AMPQE|nr:PREDICTED: carboxy-terminal domain RNA polymerase II polypeptide A small phosphatase 1-like [Amphimedon queenslandica]|eukprot:XP_019860802.1 PREDICTED: carboxy-terminal domain RNA polymerase II polypeptide A small phosphatase 1-like [Amphimedon queenslandica]